MTEVQGAFRHENSRFYWAGIIPDSVREVLEPELVEDSESLAVAARAGIVKPSLTTFIRDSSVLTVRNSKLESDELGILRDYLAACKELEKAACLPSQRKVGEGERQKVNPKRVFGLGSQIHFIAELVSSGVSFDSARQNARRRVDMRDINLFDSYSKSMRIALEDFPIFEAEVGLERERFKGTADAIAEDCVIDWKTGGAYLSKNALQLTALAVASGKKNAALVVLDSHGGAPTTIWLTPEIMQAGVTLILAGLRIFEERFEYARAVLGGEVVGFDVVKSKLLEGGHVLSRGECVSVDSFASVA